MKKITTLFLAAFAVLMIHTLALGQIPQIIPPMEKSAPQVDESVFVVPDGTLEELQSHFQKLQTYRPNMTSEEDLMAFIAKRSKAILEIADKMLAHSPKGEDLDMARQLKMGALMGICMIDAEKGLSELEAYSVELEKAADPEAKLMAVEARLRVISVKLGQIVEQKGSAQAFRETYLEAKPLIENNLNGENASFVLMLVQAGEELGDPAIMKGVMDDFLPILKKSEDPEVIQLTEMIESANRIASLVGNEMEFEAILLNGEQINLKDLQGKVVLVDFWATWCGPCLAEIPNMKKMYEKYHDKGFEIIAYSVDDEIADIEEFEKEQPHAWLVASSVKSVEKGLKDYCEFYGITGIPRMFLIGKDGKVINTEIRGPQLNKALEELFPE